MQTNLSRLILASQMERTKADFAVMSGGGVRDSIESGTITYKDVLKVQPFGNTLTYVEMKGSDVEKYLAVVANKQVDSGAYAQFANVSLVAYGTGVSEIKINGEPLQADKIYRMATLSFNATGGDGYPPVNQLPGYVNTGFVDAEVLKQYIQNHSPLNAEAFAPKGEIVYQKEAPVEKKIRPSRTSRCCRRCGNYLKSRPPSARRKNGTPTGGAVFSRCRLNLALSALDQPGAQGVVNPVIGHGVRQEEQEEGDFQQKRLPETNPQHPGCNRQTNTDKATLKA